MRSTAQVVSFVLPGMFGEREVTARHFYTSGRTRFQTAVWELPGGASQREVFEHPPRWDVAPNASATLTLELICADCRFERAPSPPRVKADYNPARHQPNPAPQIRAPWHRRVNKSLSSAIYRHHSTLTVRSVNQTWTQTPKMTSGRQ